MIRQRQAIARRTPLARSTKPLPARSKSPARLARLKLFAEARERARILLCAKQGMAGTSALVTEPFCEWPGCNHPGTDCHHTHGRRGPNLYDETKLRFVCRAHHQHIHHDPKAARALGFLQ